MLLLTLAKHSDNYFCWFQIAFSSRVWSQQVFFACWACPFRHPKRSRGKDDGFFFHFYPVALWHSLNGLFVFEAEKARERFVAEKWIDSCGWKQPGHPYLKDPPGETCCPAHPCRQPHVCVSACAHILHTQREVGSSQPSMIMHDQSRTQPAISSPSSLLVPSGARCLLDHPNPCWAARGQGDDEEGPFLGKDV